LFAALDRRDARYVLVEGMAAILHGVPRSTLDFDLLIDATPQNAQAVLDALRDAGLGTADLITADDLLAQTLTEFDDFLRVDVLLSIPGLTFTDAWGHHERRSVGDTHVRIVSIDDLIASKLAKARPKDLEDVAGLQRLRGSV
jgi:hypothetical protein